MSRLRDVKPFVPQRPCMFFAVLDASPASAFPRDTVSRLRKEVGNETTSPNHKKRTKDTHNRTTLRIMRAEDRMVSLQLRKVLNRLEDEEEEKKEALKQRVEEERRKLEATMGFSRAAAVAALAQEVELQNARKVEKTRLKVSSKSNPASTLAEASPENDRDRLLIENQRLVEEVAQLRARIHEMAGVPGSDAARPVVTIGGPAPSSTVPPSTIKARTASADDSNCRTWKGKINEEEFNRLVEIEAATVLEELRANPPAHIKALLRVRQELDACAAAAVAVRNSTSILLSSGLLPAVAGGDVRDGTAGISSSEGTRAALRGVGTISGELAHS